MDAIGIIGLLLIAANVIVSYKGFKNHNFFEKYSFEVYKVLVRKDYKVMVTSGFLHVGWVHLILNMISLYIFSESLELYLGELKFLLIYFGSLIGGNLFSLIVHKNHGDYTAVGASGAVCGIIFASIAVFPGMEVGFIGLPLFIPSWLYGILFVLYSVYGIRSRSDNIGHEAHLAGALTGLLLALLMFPEAIRLNYLPILLILIPSVAFIYFIIKRPAFLLVDNQFFKKSNIQTIDDRYNLDQRKKQEELDRILEKIHRRGMKSLNTKEREFLKNAK